MILDSKEFEKVRKIQLEILLEFDRVCKKNNIHYNIYFGTLLGAIRHQGFIPWDDDIDVVMTRDNYNKFIKLHIDDINSDYFVQNYDTDSNFFRPFTRIRKNNTRYVQRHYKNLDIHHGIFIDIFPFDYVSNHQNKEKLRYYYLHLLRRLNVIKNFGIEEDSNLIKKSIKYLIDKIIPQKWLNNHITKIITYKNNTGYLNHLTDGTIPFNNKYKKHLVSEEDFLNSRMCKFEGYEFPIPKEFDRILTNIYGDYMELPPEKDRVPHHQVIEIKC